VLKEGKLTRNIAKSSLGFTQAVFPRVGAFAYILAEDQRTTEFLDCIKAGTTARSQSEVPFGFELLPSVATIGNVRSPVYEPSRPEKLSFVPDALFPASVLEASQVSLDHLRWMMVRITHFCSHFFSKKMPWDKICCCLDLLVRFRHTFCLGILYPLSSPCIISV
jgi:hypothetical protein